MGETSTRSYESVAWFYEQLAHVFSLGLIRAAKASQIRELNPEDRILYVGAGSGEDAVLAAKSGARVTCLDLSPAMLARIRKRMEKAGLKAEYVCCDVMTYTPDTLYDAVAANFFLNIFLAPEMTQILRHLTTCVKPGGKIFIADFATSGGIFARGASRIYYLVALIFFWLLRLMPIHPIYDYAQYLKGMDTDVVKSSDFHLLGVGPCVYRSLMAVRRSG